MEKTVAPFVYWAQSNTEVIQYTLKKIVAKIIILNHQVTLRVDLRDVSGPEVRRKH